MKKLKLFALAVFALCTMLTTSTQAKNKIKGTELLRLKAYPDGKDKNGNQLYSTGWGHQIQAYELHLKTETITKDTAEKLFAGDLRPLELMINAKVPKGFTQNQFDACVDFGYNCGSGALSKCLDVWVNTHDPAKVTAYMKQYVHTKDNTTGQSVVSKDLVARRAANAATFVNPVPPAVKTVLIAAVSLGVAWYALA